MIFGKVKITGRAVQTHRDSYMLSQLSVVSVRRPFLAGSMLFSVGGLGFGWSFVDLLHPEEIAAISCFVLIAPLIGLLTGQIQLLSRDLRGSELSGMIWGTYGHLNKVRREISWAMQTQEPETPK
ncbi:hypothetical protein [uncultured Roseobacter sp.]|uniref:hypothetical protein n=1 Tax=uncultured Roseobacter sp. TaxID=114847 RepID=UPI00262CDE20|nr:hypothetical protein [uncultured Roseobacter sp.]